MELRSLRNTWADIRQGHNVDVYFTVLICLIVSVLGIVDVVDLKIVASAILAVLSLEAVSLLTNRRTEQELKQSLEEVLKRQHQRRLSEIFTPFGQGVEDRRKRLKQADEVWILSRTCRMLWEVYQEELKTVAGRGGLKLLLLDPSDHALDMVAESAIWRLPDDGKKLKGDVQDFLNRLKLIRDTLQLTKFEVKLIDHLPAWTLILINPRKTDGAIYTELATYRSHSRKRPSFVVKCNLATIYSTSSAMNLSKCGMMHNLLGNK